MLSIEKKLNLSKLSLGKLRRAPGTLENKAFQSAMHGFKVAFNEQFYN